MKFLCLLGMMVAARDSLLHHWRWYEEEMQKPDTVRRVPSPSIMKLYHLLIFTFVLNRCPTIHLSGPSSPCLCAPTTLVDLEEE